MKRKERGGRGRGWRRSGGYRSKCSKRNFIVSRFGSGKTLIRDLNAFNFTPSSGFPAIEIEMGDRDTMQLNIGATDNVAVEMRQIWR